MLKRLYLDRIFAPVSLSCLQYVSKINDIPNLACENCKMIIGNPIIYEKENRKAFYLRQGLFKKKTSKGIFLY
ncbi:MAG: hypothetical protein C4584_00485 [Armatimonadetes bacterium]|nr:MAG: hypothetical protein C4584_00485 [Armatimonadota bacterium]